MPKKKQPFYKSSGLRLSMSLSTILLLYRLLFRFLSRLRAHLLDPSAAPFRNRNPRTWRTLSSPYAPAVGASIAGVALGIYPSQQLRVTVAIAAIFRALEFGWNLCEDEGLIWGWKASAGGKGVKPRERPWWWGSWMLQPLACGQLLHATMFDRDCSPAGFVDFIWKSSTTYLHNAPNNLPEGMVWPNAWEVADNLAQMAKLNWPYVALTLTLTLTTSSLPLDPQDTNSFSQLLHLTNNVSRPAYPAFLSQHPCAFDRPSSPAHHVFELRCPASLRSFVSPHLPYLLGTLLSTRGPLLPALLLDTHATTLQTALQLAVAPPKPSNLQGTPSFDLHYRCHIHGLGQLVLLSGMATPHIPTNPALLPRWLPRRFVGVGRAQGRQKRFLVQCADKRRLAMEGGSEAPLVACHHEGRRRMGLRLRACHYRCRVREGRKSYP